jgi:hypothetical protein
MVPDPKEPEMLTRHAEVRCQQRGISPEVVDALLNYGRRRRHRGAEVCFMDKGGRQQLERELGCHVYARIATRLDSYLVVSDEGTIITAAKHRRRLKF